MQFVKAILPLVPFVLLGYASAAQAADPIDARKLSETAVALVETSKPGSATKSFAAGTIINAPVEKLCALIQDYPDYPSFMPNTASVKVAMSKPGHTIIDVTLSLPLGKIKKYRLRMEPVVTAAACKVAWSQLPWKGLKPEETIADTTGYWEFTAAPAAGKSIVKYVVATDPGPVPFGLGWIVDSLSKDSIPLTLEGLRKKAAQQ